MPPYEHWYRPDRFEHGYDLGYQRARGRFAERPWVGGYIEGFQGGSGGIELGTSGERVWQEWVEQRFARPPERLHGRRRPAGYARDFGTRRRYGTDFGGTHATWASAYGYDYGYRRRPRRY